MFVLAKYYGNHIGRYVVVLVVEMTVMVVQVEEQHILCSDDVSLNRGPFEMDTTEAPNRPPIRVF